VSSIFRIFRFVSYNTMHDGPSIPSFHLPDLKSKVMAATTTAPGGESYAPNENLERVDLNLINQSKDHLDIAMYAFTDRELADAVVNAAHRGVKVRIYRDNEQYRDEQERNPYVRNVLASANSISIRVKGTRDLMHLKEFSDGTFVREGSANWSPSGEKHQDNSVVVFTDRGSINAFEQKFDEMWDRPSNYKVQ
jgi:phosphatidylserine/phosphatidylglycerophosphate/cardiolipin synthase-like enzyme